MPRWIGGACEDFQAGKQFCRFLILLYFCESYLDSNENQALRIRYNGLFTLQFVLMPNIGSRNNANNLQLFFIVALLAHTGRGISPALARYFQVVLGLPLMAFVVMGSLPAVVGYLVYTLPRSGWKVWRHRILWLTGSILIVRVISNVAAARFTKAIYVQLFALMTPFLVVVFGRIFLKEAPPRYTWTAILFSFTGALLMLSSDISSAGINLNLSSSDQIGIAFAIIQAVTSAIYFLLLRQARKEAIESHEIVTTQSTLVMLFALPVSFLRGEDWSTFLQLTAWQWVLLLFFMLFTVLIANFLQVVSIARIGAHAFSSALPWRLLSVMVLSWFLLGERLESIWQALGALIVFIAITGYFYSQRE